MTAGYLMFIYKYVCAMLRALVVYRCQRRNIIRCSHGANYLYNQRKYNILFSRFREDLNNNKTRSTTRPGFLETNLSQNSDLSLRFYSNLRNLKKNAFLEKNLAQILTQLEKKLKLPPHQT